MQYFCTRISIVFRVLEFSVSRLQRMRNRLLILLWSMGLFVPLTAFGVEIRGVVLDSLTEESLVGATIVIKGEPSNGTTTGLDGTFVLRTEVAHPVVCCSYMGYESVEVPYTGSRMTLRLREQTTAISEVTVVSNYNGSTGAKAIEIERVVFIDTTPLIGKYHKDSLDYPSVPQQDAKKQLSWLEEELSAAKEDWVVVVGHHPIYAHTTKSESERKDMQKRVDPIFRRHNVDMYICGHIHNFQHIKPQGTSIDYVVNSAGSLARSKVEAIEGTVFASGEAGFSILSFTKDELCLDLINGKGKTIHSVKRTKNAQR